MKKEDVIKNIRAEFKEKGIFLRQNEDQSITLKKEGALIKTRALILGMSKTLALKIAETSGEVNQELLEASIYYFLQIKPKIMIFRWVDVETHCDLSPFGFCFMGNRWSKSLQITPNEPEEILLRRISCRFSQYAKGQVTFSFEIIRDQEKTTTEEVVFGIFCTMFDRDDYVRMVYKRSNNICEYQKQDSAKILKLEEVESFLDQILEESEKKIRLKQLYNPSMDYTRKFIYEYMSSVTIEVKSVFHFLKNYFSAEEIEEKFALLYHSKGNGGYLTHRHLALLDFGSIVLLFEKNKVRAYESKYRKKAQECFKEKIVELTLGKNKTEILNRISQK